MKLSAQSKRVKAVWKKERAKRKGGKRGKKLQKKMHSEAHGDVKCGIFDRSLGPKAGCYDGALSSRRPSLPPLPRRRQRGSCGNTLTPPDTDSGPSRRSDDSTANLKEFAKEYRGMPVCLRTSGISDFVFAPCCGCWAEPVNDSLRRSDESWTR